MQLNDKSFSYNIFSILLFCFKVMKPLAKALDILQGEKYMYMGAFLPTIWSILKTLDEMASLQVCGALVDAVRLGVSSRYGILTTTFLCNCCALYE